MMRPMQDPQKRINEILDAAEQLFFEKGYDRTTVKDIAKVMGVAQGTMYYYFKSKEEVLKGVIDRKADLVLSEMHRIALQPVDGWAKLSEMLSSLLQIAATDNGNMMALMYRDNVVPYTMKILDDISKHMDQELSLFIGSKGSGKDIEVDSPECALFFVKELANSLANALLDTMTPIEWSRRLAIGECLIATTLGGAPGQIKINMV